MLNVDASSVGLGAVKMQDGKPVAFGLKTLSPAETRYANIKQELLAIVWGADKFHTYVYQKIREASNCDVTSQVVIQYVVKGWPAERNQLDELAREYWSFREELSVEDGLLFKADRIVVPRSLRAEVLEEIHGAHMGENKSLSFAREYVFWPSMTAQIKDKVRSCPICNAFCNHQPRETLHPHEVPALPRQVVSTDIFEYGGHSYLLVTDFYSKYFGIELLRQTTANCVTNNLKKIFARYGIPAEVLRNLFTRNLFNSSHEFKRFADETI